MELTAVESSNIEAIGYDSALKEMRVRFKGGATYQIDELPEEEHAALMAAESKGKHYRARIAGKFPTKKLEQATP